MQCIIIIIWIYMVNSKQSKNIQKLYVNGSSFQSYVLFKTSSPKRNLGAVQLPEYPGSHIRWECPWLHKNGGCTPFVSSKQGSWLQKIQHLRWISKVMIWNQMLKLCCSKDCQESALKLKRYVRGCKLRYQTFGTHPAISASLKVIQWDILSHPYFWNTNSPRSRLEMWKHSNLQTCQPIPWTKSAVIPISGKFSPKASACNVLPSVLVSPRLLPITNGPRIERPKSGKLHTELHRNTSRDSGKTWKNWTSYLFQESSPYSRKVLVGSTWHHLPFSW